LALLGQDFVLAAGLGVELGKDGGRLALGLDAALLGFGLGLDDDLGLLGLRRRFQRGPPFRLDTLGLGECRLGHGAVLGFLHGGLSFAFAGFAYLVGLGLLDLELGLGVGDLGLGLVLARDRLGVGLGYRDAHLLLGRLDLGIALEVGGLLADPLL